VIVVRIELTTFLKKELKFGFTFPRYYKPMDTPTSSNPLRYLPIPTLQRIVWFRNLAPNGYLPTTRLELLHLLNVHFNTYIDVSESDAITRFSLYTRSLAGDDVERVDDETDDIDEERFDTVGAGGQSTTSSSHHVGNGVAKRARRIQNQQQHYYQQQQQPIQQYEEEYVGGNEENGNTMMMMMMSSLPPSNNNTSTNAAGVPIPTSSAPPQSTIQTVVPQLPTSHATIATRHGNNNFPTTNNIATNNDVAPKRKHVAVVGLSLEIGSLIAGKDSNGQWMLMNVTGYNPKTKLVLAEDGDEALGPGDKESFQLPLNSVLLLPTRDGPPRAPYAIGTRVLAQFPGTTSFYPAIVNKILKRTTLKAGRAQLCDYMLQFDDDEEGEDGEIIPKRVKGELVVESGDDL
jgi:hypothetical protein